MHKTNSCLSRCFLFTNHIFENTHLRPGAKHDVLPLRLVDASLHTRLSSFSPTNFGSVRSSGLSRHLPCSTCASNEGKSGAAAESIQNCKYGEGQLRQSCSGKTLRRDVLDQWPLRWIRSPRGARAPMSRAGCMEGREKLPRDCTLVHY